MLGSAVVILLLGFVSGQLARRLGAPPLIGMILAGIVIGPELGHFISAEFFNLADDLRTIAVMVILMRAGLGLDRDKLMQQGSVALRLGFLPATTEAIAVAVAATLLFQFDFLTGLLLGCVVGAESPAVIVPGMLRLKSLGWGIGKGIPDVILTGSALSDVLVLLVFSLLLNFLAGTVGDQAIAFLPLQVGLQIALGLLLGCFAARLLVWLAQWLQNTVQATLTVAGMALSLILLAQSLPYSGYLATMALGFFLLEFDPPLARQMRIEFNHLWVVAEIVLFVLLGASIQLEMLENLLLPGGLILAVGLFVGRPVGWYLATLGSNWTGRERLFLLPGNSAKATVQAAIGAIPLSRGVEGGEVILAIAALSILTTAPLGAWAIGAFAPKLLTQSPVDPTKVTVDSHTLVLAAVDTSLLATAVLTKAADLARRSNGEVIVLHVTNHPHTREIEQLRQHQRLLLDIRHQFIFVNGPVPEAIVQTAQDYQATDIVMGKRGHRSLEDVLIGSVSQSVIETSSIPVTLVEDSQANTKFS